MGTGRREEQAHLNHSTRREHSKEGGGVQKETRDLGGEVGRDRDKRLVGEDLAMNMAMGPCLAWPRSHSNVRGWHVRMLGFQGSPPPQSIQASTLVFHSPSTHQYHGFDQLECLLDPWAPSPLPPRTSRVACVNAGQHSRRSQSPSEDSSLRERKKEKERKKGKKHVLCTTAKERYRIHVWDNLVFRIW